MSSFQPVVPQDCSFLCPDEAQILDSHEGSKEILGVIPAFPLLPLSSYQFCSGLDLLEVDHALLRALSGCKAKSVPAMCRHWLAKITNLKNTNSVEVSCLKLFKIFFSPVIKSKKWRHNSVSFI